MSDELELGDTDDEILNTAKVLRAYFVDVFAAHHQHAKQAKGEDLDGLALALARRIGPLSTGISDHLHKAAEQLGDAVKPWPTTERFAKALASVEAAQRAAKRHVAAPIGWRWKRGEERPEGVDPRDWYVASLKQETAAKEYFRADHEARSLAALANNQGWLCTLYWFVVDTGRLPSVAEEGELISTAIKADTMALDAKANGVYHHQVLALRQSMHDYASRQLGLPAQPIREQTP